MTDETPTPGAEPQSKADKARRSVREGLGALTDLSFTKSATPLVAKVLYILAIVVAVGGWIFGALKMIVFGLLGAMHGGGRMMGRDGHGPMMGGNGGAMMVACGFLWLLFGWIGALVLVMIARLVLEFFVDHHKAAQR